MKHACTDIAHRLMAELGNPAGIRLFVEDGPQGEAICALVEADDAGAAADRLEYMAAQLRHRHARRRAPVEPACPRCGQAVDTATTLGTKPLVAAGDLTVCLNCAAALRLDESLRLRPIDLDITQSEDPVLAQALRAAMKQVRDFNRMRYLADSWRTLKADGLQARRVNRDFPDRS